MKDRVRLVSCLVLIAKSLLLQITSSSPSQLCLAFVSYFADMLCVFNVNFGLWNRVLGHGSCGIKSQATAVIESCLGIRLSIKRAT